MLSHVSASFQFSHPPTAGAVRLSAQRDPRGQHGEGPRGEPGGVLPVLLVAPRRRPQATQTPVRGENCHKVTRMECKLIITKSRLDCKA